MSKHTLANIKVFRNPLPDFESFYAHFQSACKAYGVHWQNNGSESNIDLIVCDFESYLNGYIKLPSYTCSGNISYPPVMLLFHCPIFFYCTIPDLLPPWVTDFSLAGNNYQELSIRVLNIIQQKRRNDETVQSLEAQIKSLEIVLEKTCNSMKNLKSKLCKKLLTFDITVDSLLGRQLLSLVEETLPDRSDWKQHYYRSTLYTDRVLARLRKAHPTLTIGELRYCCLIYNNLRCEEIANVLGVSVSAIEKKKFRLKRKMGLKGRHALENQLQKIL